MLPPSTMEIQLFFMLPILSHKSRHTYNTTCDNTRSNSIDNQLNAIRNEGLKDIQGDGEEIIQQQQRGVISYCLSFSVCLTNKSILSII